jgi:magnesium transporter
MLNVFVPRPQGLTRVEHSLAEPLPSDSLWLDLLEPTPSEEKSIEQALSIDVPTREEMREIEASNRVYEEDGSLYMTATIVTKLDTDLPESTQVTFILAGSRLVTNRYVDPLPFRRFISYAQKHPGICVSSAMLLAGLLEAIINRIADVIERVGADLDAISADVFSPRRRRQAPRDFRQVLSRIGQGGEKAS